MKVLPYPRQDQERSNWCWAAVSVAIDHYHDPQSGWRQCRMVHEEFNRRCCEDPERACNRTSKLQDALRRINRLASRPPEKVVLTFEQVKAEINAGRPIGVRISWRPTQPGAVESGAHFVVISGYDVTERGVETLMVEDPNPDVGQVRVPYRTFVSRYQHEGRWNATFFIAECAAGS